jgi:hypothetical protein
VPWLAQASKNIDNHVKPEGLPVTAGAPVLTPNFRRGSTCEIQFVAATDGSTSLPPVDAVPSGSLYVMIWVTFLPPDIIDLTSDKNEVLGDQSIGTNSNSLCVRLEYAGEGETW